MAENLSILATLSVIAARYHLPREGEDACGVNPLRLCCANPPPPRGEVLLYLSADAKKLPLSGELARRKP